jgi:hybrid cluster-associated redox disulfide protein
MLRIMGTAQMTQSTEPITEESLVQDLVVEHPETILVFARHGLSCVGCYIAPFHTIADSAREHDLCIEPLLGDLNRALVRD